MTSPASVFIISNFTSSGVIACVSSGSSVIGSLTSTSMISDVTSSSLELSFKERSRSSCDLEAGLRLLSNWCGSFRCIIDVGNKGPIQDELGYGWNELDRK